jgi:hypothetical protein
VWIDGPEHAVAGRLEALGLVAGDGAIVVDGHVEGEFQADTIASRGPSAIEEGRRESGATV